MTTIYSPHNEHTFLRCQCFVYNTWYYKTLNLDDVTVYMPLN